MKKVISTGIILVCLLGVSCSANNDFDEQLDSIVRPHVFNIASWELVAIPDELYQVISDKPEKSDDEIGTVIEYFNTTERIQALKLKIEAVNTGNEENNLVLLKKELNELQERKSVLEGTVESIIEKQIRETLIEQGIYNPIIKSRISFPPINFRLEKPPFLLVISPRDRIDSIKEVTLQPDLVLEEMEDIEARVDELGVSSLVVAIGGFGATYPTLVTDRSSLIYTIESVAEEWLHQYLVFTPLGFLFLLDVSGFSRNYEIATMNETVAGIISKEISSIVYEKYYSDYENGTSQNQTEESEFDFNMEMREIRKTVDNYLAQGEIEKAEEFMEQKREYLAARGYYIRKLNQAYFAFHGAYADEPAFISPIGLELQELRSQSPSLKEFLNTVATMTSHQDIKDSIR